MSNMIKAVVAVVLVLVHATGAVSEPYSSIRKLAEDVGLPRFVLPSSEPMPASITATDITQLNACGPLTRELIDQHAAENTLIIMAVDSLLLKRFVPSWLQNIAALNVTNWLIAALDPGASQGLRALGVSQCFNAPLLGHTSPESDLSYVWGSKHWHDTTWAKVRVVQAVYAHGVHVLHCDADTTWFADPMPWVRQQMSSPDTSAHVVFSTDSLETHNPAGDEGLEASTSPHYNINTGVYFIRQWSAGGEFLDVWLAWQPKKIGHDQDGLNIVARGEFRGGDKSLPRPVEEGAPPRMFFAALHNTTRLSFMPVHIWGNAYTYRIGRVHEVLGSRLQVIHWVWTGGSPECKVQAIRDAQRYADPPWYYGATASPPSLTDPLAGSTAQPTAQPGAGDAAQPSAGQGWPPGAGPEAGPLMLVTMDLDVPPMPAGFNEITDLAATESMVGFHLSVVRYQLYQAYWGLMAAAALGRVWVLPPFQCFCAKNWYMTQRCRINGERHTLFPYACALPDVMRARRVMSGIAIPRVDVPVVSSPTGDGARLSPGASSLVDGFTAGRAPDGEGDQGAGTAGAAGATGATGAGAPAVITVHVRESNFLSHPRVPPEIKGSRLVLVPDGPSPRPDTAPPLRPSDVPAPERQADGSAVLRLPWPLDTHELQQVMSHQAGSWRVVHLTNATALLGKGWRDAGQWRAYDEALAKYTTTWCCRSPEDMAAYNLPVKEPLDWIPASRGAGRV